MTPTPARLPAVDPLARMDEGVHRATYAWLAGFTSPHTRRAYLAAVGRWQAWAGTHGVSVLEPDRPSMQVWVAWMRERDDLSPATIRQRTAAVSSWLAWLADERLRADTTPLRRLRLPHPTLPSSEQLTTDQVRRILAAADTLDGPAATAIALLVTAGLRADEAGRIGLRSVETSPWGRCLRVAGKGDKGALLPLQRRVLEMADRHGWPADAGRSPAEAARRVRRWVAVASAAAGVTLPSGRGPTPHDFRHWFVTTALAADVPLHLVQDAARHADPSTTRRYDRTAGSVAGVQTVADAVIAALDSA